MTVPTLSLARFTHGTPAERAGFEAALLTGLKRFGFVILTDHGVPIPLIERAYALAAEFFASDETIKRRFACGMRGYTPFGTEHARDSHVPDLKEFWQVGREVAPANAPEGDFPPNVWPESPAEFRATFIELFAALDTAGQALLSALAPGLGLGPDAFQPMVQDGTSILRVLHYPPVPDDAPAGAVRSAAHEDINFLTLLVAAKGAGLQLLDRDGRWLPVETEPTNLIVDSGDMMQRLTGGIIPSTTHRVVNPSGPNVSRYSMPFFMHPASHVSLATLPSCLGGPKVQPPISAGDFLAERLREIGLAV